MSLAGAETAVQAPGVGVPGGTRVGAAGLVRILVGLPAAREGAVLATRR